jgi:tRNA (cytidine/uridine-2'-O-)-methyltransferase
VGPLGFEISDRYLKRAGLDYWPYVELHYHQTFSEFQKIYRQKGGRLVGFSVRGSRKYTRHQFEKDDWLLFGSETQGLSESVLQLCDATVYIPISQPNVRSFNLSVSVAIGLFEARRQLDKD